MRIPGGQAPLTDEMQKEGARGALCRGTLMGMIRDSPVSSKTDCTSARVAISNDIRLCFSDAYETKKLGVFRLHGRVKCPVVKNRYSRGTQKLNPYAHT